MGVCGVPGRTLTYYGHRTITGMIPDTAGPLVTEEVHDPGILKTYRRWRELRIAAPTLMLSLPLSFKNLRKTVEKTGLQRCFCGNEEGKKV